MTRIAITLVVGLALFGSGAPCAAEEEARVHVVADFDGGETSGQFRAVDSEAELVSAGPDGSKALQWRQVPAQAGGWLAIRVLPEDIRPFRSLRFRARCLGAYHDEVVVLIRSADGTIGAELRGLTDAWQTIEMLLPEMKQQREFDPTGVERLTLACWETKGFTLEIDDIVLLKEKGGWRYTADELQARGIDTAGPVYRIGDFEDDRAVKRVEAVESTLEGVAAKPRRKGRCARWAVPKGENTAWITLPNFPKDIREYRQLRMSVRSKDRLPDEVHVRIRGGEGYLTKPLPDLKKKTWNDIVIPLPTMSSKDDFDPEKVWGLRFVVFRPNGCELDIDDIELVKGAGGWRMSKEERLAWLFGKKRRKKVKEIETSHFRVFTDCSAAKRKFPKALEKIYDFVLETLPLGGFREDDRLDVFIFQNPEIYFDFCVRRGWTREAAERTAGHAWSGFFATYYQSPSAATVVHELTHSLFHRAMGTGGGSWFQEGAAVCVEERWQKRDAAKLFATQLRGDRYVPLAEFLETDRLIRAHDVRGGANTSHALYLQAGALFEFLMRGPFAQAHPDALNQLAQLEWDEDSIVEDVERIYGTSLAEIETVWLEWGADPPKVR